MLFVCLVVRPTQAKVQAALRSSTFKSRVKEVQEIFTTMTVEVRERFP